MQAAPLSDDEVIAAAEQAEFLAAVEEGLRSAREHGTIPHEVVKAKAAELRAELLARMRQKLAAASNQR